MKRDDEKQRVHGSGTPEENNEVKEQQASDSKGNEQQDSGQSDPYAYSEGEFDPDKWENDHKKGKKRKNKSRENTIRTQKGLAVFVCGIALILFVALFIVEFQSYTKVSRTDNSYVSNNDDESDTPAPVTSIMTVIETGTNYTIYLDNETGVEYVMFKVGSSINIQPLINADGSYKKYQPPVLETETATDASGKRIQHKTTAVPAASSSAISSSDAASSKAATASVSAASQADKTGSDAVTEPTRASAEE